MNAFTVRHVDSLTFTLKERGSSNTVLMRVEKGKKNPKAVACINGLRGAVHHRSSRATGCLIVAMWPVSCSLLD